MGSPSPKRYVSLLRPDLDLRFSNIPKLNTYWNEFVADDIEPGIHPTIDVVAFSFTAEAPGEWEIFAGASSRSVPTATYELTLTVQSNLPVPTRIDDCKKDGWKKLYRADGTPFKNQGDCVSYVNTGK